LIYYETENYVKAATAFEQALKLEDELAARHIAYAKVQEKLGNAKLMIDELQRAVDLEPNHESFSLLVKGYESLGMQAEADQAISKLDKLIVPTGKNKRRVSRPKRVVI
jgi:tetratricopeptide (TPR) repeat protein